MRVIPRTLTVIALLAPCACASVTMPIPGLGGPERADAEPLQEHTALRQAADGLSAAVPQAAVRAEKGGLHTIVFGGRDDAERAAARTYLATLGPQAGSSVVLADADAVLAAGRDVAATGLLASGDAAQSADVALLEDAITQVQRARRLLTTALKIMREEGEPLTKSEIRELGDAFVQTARDIGTAADLAAARDGADVPVYADRPAGGTSGY